MEIGASVLQKENRVSPQNDKRIRILGCRGIPARHGGFETFAANLSPYLTDKGWDVTVYTQIGPSDLEPGQELVSGRITEDDYHGIRRVKIEEKRDSALGAIIFDWRSVLHAARERGVVLTLGYNTAIFNLILRLFGHRLVTNMDGIEWRRSKWSWSEKLWLLINEFAGCWTSHHLIADHPEIGNHLATRSSRQKISVIAYGAAGVDTADPVHLKSFGVKPREYFMLVSRIEPENSVLEIVQAYSLKKRSKPLLVIGKFDMANDYHRDIIEAASEDVKFVGVVYDPEILGALRYHTRGYMHGHTVGGTNPSLVEALGAGSPVIAHRNPFNMHVAGAGQLFFSTVDDCSAAIDKLVDDDARVTEMSKAAKARHQSEYTWEFILSSYDVMLSRQLPAAETMPREAAENLGNGEPSFAHLDQARQAESL